MSSNLDALRALASEWRDTVEMFDRAAFGLDEAALIKLRLEQNAILAEIARKQARHLRFMAGEKIEPENHECEAVLFAVGGLES